MEQPRLTLDNDVFSGRLRKRPAGQPYINREVARPGRRIQDIVPQTVNTANLASRPQPQGQPLPPVEQKASQRPAQVESTQAAKTSLKEKFTRPAVLYAMAGFVFLVGLAVSMQGLRTNHLAQAQVNRLASSASGNNSSSGTPPSTSKPSAYALSSYQVAPDLPRYIDIPNLSVHARVFSVGTTKSGALGTPNNVYDTAWYNASAKPGQPGAMLIDGHVSSWTTKGVFYSLTKLVAGNTIKITRGDGQVFSYSVVKTKLYDASSVDMASLLVSANTSKPGLNLISCSGDVIPGTNEFNKRIAVFAVEN